jgi:SAM-dependent methyltransferase
MLRAILRTAGLRPRHLAAAIGGWRRYARERKAFLSLKGADAIPLGRDFPILDEYSQSSGNLGAYFFQDLQVARWVLTDKPRRHVDVGSRLDGFIGHLAVFREVDVLDIRPQPVAVPNTHFHQVDLLGELPPQWVACTDSLSCLHTIEHFGLGRYGDPLDPLGHVKGLAQMKRMVKPGGRFYLSTPIGPERVEFNAHRIFAAPTVIGWFQDGWTIERFAVVDDDELLHPEVDWRSEAANNHFGCKAGVGIVCAIRSDSPVSLG